MFATLYSRLHNKNGPMPIHYIDDVNCLASPRGPMQGMSMNNSNLDHVPAISSKGDMIYPSKLNVITPY